MLEIKNKVLITGSSGYVASHLIPMLSKYGDITGIDLLPSNNTEIIGSISDNFLTSNNLNSCSLIVVNLAAARFDFGAKAKEYYNKNITDHLKFLKNLEPKKVKKFIHISSVAAIDGRNIPYSDNLSCDDAYRATKYLQEELIQKWCKTNDIELIVLYPSAIFSNNPRPDTNIGKLQSISRIIPFIPKIDVKKSLTYLPNFSEFILDSLLDKIPAGKYLTINQPILTVSNMIQIISGRQIASINIPYFKQILKSISYFFYIIGGFGKIDLKLTPNRVEKLYSDTSYDGIELQELDLTKYSARYNEQLSKILSKLNIEKNYG